MTTTHATTPTTPTTHADLHLVIPHQKDAYLCRCDNPDSHAGNSIRPLGGLGLGDLVHLGLMVRRHKSHQWIRVIGLIEDLCDPHDPEGRFAADNLRRWAWENAPTDWQCVVALGLLAGGKL